MLNDPSPIWHPVPVASQAVPAVPGWVRVLGAASGLLVAMVFVLGAWFVDATSRGNPIGPTVVPPIVAAGVVGGWIVAPDAWAARTRRQWVRAIVVLAVLAVLIGDATTVVDYVAGASAGPATGAAYPLAAMAGMAELFILGLVFVGWWALAITALAAWVWSGVFATARALLT